MGYRYQYSSFTVQLGEWHDNVPERPAWQERTHPRTIPENATRKVACVQNIDYAMYAKKSSYISPIVYDCYSSYFVSDRH